MSGCIIHFGMHKTGSSSIQESLFSGLDDPRFHYAQLGSANPSGAIRLAFERNPGSHWRSRVLALDDTELASRAAKVRADLDEQLSHAREKTVILSSEGLISLAESELRAVIDLVRSHTANVTAVGYVRAPRSHMESAFQQRLKMGNHHGMDLDSVFPRYRLQLEKFISALGAENVQFWRFEPSALVNGCVVRDFCTRLGISFDPARILRRNESLSLPGVQLLYAYYKFGPGIGTGRPALVSLRLLAERLAAAPGPPLRFHPSLTAPLIAEHRAEIGWMQARLGGPFTKRPRSKDETTVRGEADLLTFTPATIEWLDQQLDRTPDRSPRRIDPREVAASLHTLRQLLLDRSLAAGRARLAGAANERTAASALSPRELLAEARQGNPLIASIDNEAAESLLQQVFRQLRRRIDQLDEDTLDVEHLGQFSSGLASTEGPPQPAAGKRTIFR